jgi:hypothetical protein
MDRNSPSPAVPAAGGPRPDFALRGGAWFAVLGPLLVLDGDVPVDLPRGRLRVLLAALLRRAGKAVPADELAEVVWDGAPPRQAGLGRHLRAPPRAVPGTVGARTSRAATLRGVLRPCGHHDE